MSVTQSCFSLCKPIGCLPPCSSVLGILQASIMEWASIPFSRWSPWPRFLTLVCCISGRFITVCTTREAKKKALVFVVSIRHLSHIWLIATLWTIAHQAILCMRFSRKEYWSRLWWLFLEDHYHPEIQTFILLCLLHFKQLLYLLSNEKSP